MTIFEFLVTFAAIPAELGATRLLMLPRMFLSKIDPFGYINLYSYIISISLIMLILKHNG